MYYSSPLLNKFVLYLADASLWPINITCPRGREGRQSLAWNEGQPWQKYYSAPFRLSKFFSLVSRRILIQKYSSKFKRGQDLILSGQKRTLPLRSNFSSSLVHEHSASHSSVSTWQRLWFTMGAKDIIMSWASCSTATFSLDQLLIFWLQVGFCFFPLQQMRTPFSPSTQKSLFSTFHCTFEKLFKISLHLDLFRKRLFNLIIPKQAFLSEQCQNSWS